MACVSKTNKALTVSDRISLFKVLSTNADNTISLKPWLMANVDLSIGTTETKREYSIST